MEYATICHSQSSSRVDSTFKGMKFVIIPNQEISHNNISHVLTCISSHHGIHAVIEQVSTTETKSQSFA